VKAPGILPRNAAILHPDEHFQKITRDPRRRGKPFPVDRFQQLLAIALDGADEVNKQR
jgi:hypothetical protein